MNKAAQLISLVTPVREGADTVHVDSRVSTGKSIGGVFIELQTASTGEKYISMYGTAGTDPGVTIKDIPKLISALQKIEQQEK